MTKRPIRLGEMLVQMGRVTADEVERALAHQQAHGGYMGDALVALGILSREELWWGLANQHDIPFVHLRPENIDHALASRVSAAWAAEHRILPVLWDEGRVTVVMPDLGGVERLDEVRLLTGATEVVPALTSPESIAELIEAVHGPAEGVGLAAFLAEALERGATAFGVSARPGRATGWYRAGDVVCRALAPEWRDALGGLVSPAAPPAGETAWSAVARVGGDVRTLECHALVSGEATEWAAVSGARLAADAARVEADAALVRRAREARRAGGVAARVVCPPGAHRAAEALLALLPALLLGDGARAIHLSDRAGAAPPGTLVVSTDGSVGAAAAGLEPFVPDAVTVGVEALAADDLMALRRVAPFVAVLERHDAAPAAEFDCVARLRLDEGGPAWMLE
ncbi:hypothetical protein [Longimicrobium sp.]|uniref:GspE/PulE/PilB domain-containing protein n=1 Tax=Longimicrobium sp. TaxID=2029185 RepID=UPI002E333B00|nr:hypothetical protein [Longimicrobium sp.]HEX6037664.1 hypothetical protein [Longimicrobium sp.]